MLPAKVMSPGEAAKYLQPFLLDGEFYISDGLAQSMDIAKRFGVQGAGEGRMFVTNARIIHWVEETEEPWLYLDFSEVLRVEQTDRDVPRFARANGMTQLLLHTSTQAGRLQFLANARLSRELAARYAPTPPQTPPPQAQAKPAPEPPPDARAGFPLPPVKANERIPTRQASLKNTRVLDMSSLEARMPDITRVQDAIDRELNSDEHRALMGSISETVVSEYRRHVDAGVLPGFDPELLNPALGMGIAMALVEKRAGWRDPATIHPVIHSSLAMLAFTMGEREGPGPGLVVDAAFNLARGNVYPTVFAT